LVDFHRWGQSWLFRPMSELWEFSWLWLTDDLFSRCWCLCCSVGEERRGSGSHFFVNIVFHSLLISSSKKKWCRINRKVLFDGVWITDAAKDLLPLSTSNCVKRQERSQAQIRMKRAPPPHLPSLVSSVKASCRTTGRETAFKDCFQRLLSKTNTRLPLHEQTEWRTKLLQTPVLHPRDRNQLHCTSCCKRLRNKGRVSSTMERKSRTTLR
jgi:hypothetical protein